MEYIRSLRTGIMVEYPVMSPSQGTYLRIEQTSEAKRETYEMCRAGGGGGGTGIENRCFNGTRDANKETWLRVIRVYARSNKVWVKSTVSTVFGPHLICREVKLNQLPQILWFLCRLGPNQSITTTLCSSSSCSTIKTALFASQFVNLPEITSSHTSDEISKQLTYCVVLQSKDMR